MRVSELADHLSVTPDTVRYYTRLGYVSPRRHPENGYKDYDEEDQRRLRFIVNARELGFTVADIGDLLKAADQGKSPCATTRQLLAQRLQETEQRFQEMVALRSKMQAALEAWEDQPDKTPTGHMICHLIETLSAQVHTIEQQTQTEKGL